MFVLALGMHRLEQCIKYLPSKNAGQPQPELNLVELLYNGVLQPAQE